MIEPKAEKPAHLPAAAVGQLLSATISSVRPVFPPARLRRPMPVLEISVFQWTAMVSSHMSSSLQAALSIMMNANGQNSMAQTATLLVQTTHMKLYGTLDMLIGTTLSLETGPLTSGPAILTKNVRKAALPKKIVFPQHREKPASKAVKISASLSRVPPGPGRYYDEPESGLFHAGRGRTGSKRRRHPSGVREYEKRPMELVPWAVLLKKGYEMSIFPLTEKNGRGKIKHLSTAGGKSPASYLNRSIAYFPEECKSGAEGF